MHMNYRLLSHMANTNLVKSICVLCRQICNDKI
ncbi:hypothetical protein KL86PLE_130280 [uncultured Pleomorphomonas sp.]|uniref:Uncharacterized protein n=1 Tax=uncultured Pleomorphomonas sp. TaxID=442121 RepID=A0A212LAK5_9HYPH|nr:hypothetical protein KL86PLE_130280 [uncultured Pleomorphomonas sp.]